MKPTPLTIAIDFDGTLDVAVRPLSHLIATCRQEPERYNVIVVTSRRRDPEDPKFVEKWLAEQGFPKLPIYYTEGIAKRFYMEWHNVKVDIWIDDCPSSIENGR